MKSITSDMCESQNMIKKQTPLKHRFNLIIILFSVFTLFSPSVHAKEEKPSEETEGHMINFQQVPMRELIKFIGRIAEVNFLAPDDLIDFDVNFVSGKPSSKAEVLQALFFLLKEHHLKVEKNGPYYVIKKKPEEPKPTLADPTPPKEPEAFPELLEDTTPKEKKVEALPLPTEVKKKGKFHLYKLQYHQGSEILSLLKSSTGDMLSSFSDIEMMQSIQSMQWMESTNSLFFSGNAETIQKICSLIRQIDSPLKQALIEVLVIETNFNNSLEFGLKLSANSKFNNYLSGTSSSTSPSSQTLPFIDTMKQVSNDHFPSPADMPVSTGLDLGVIGDIIFHKGRSFLSLGALVSALQSDVNFTIVYNQKILTQENKSSQIFVGDNIPFAGSVVQTIGNNQQTTANVEYRDVGVTLKITPLIGENDIISLEISEEISEALDHPIHKTNQLSGIKTSKTNMVTNAHVPDNHFLILSGMSKSIKSRASAGPPCLGGIPFLSNLLSKKDRRDEKTNIMVFVKPHIVHNAREFQDLSKDLKKIAFNKASSNKAS